MLLALRSVLPGQQLPGKPSPPTAPSITYVYQPHMAQTKASSPAVPGRGLPNQSQLSPRDLTRACISSGCGP